ncbi:hypothetical protein ACFY2M_09390 [Streptomyces sp. NPDC001276]|uniref:hypothetical protein n=1 Tax=Streptomyces sp. NPDC001276 TaxID=3364555 RepID=UPI0036A672C5
MPTPYGTRGGMAFGAEELPVLRRALALALQPRPASAEDVQECRRLAESLDEAMHEGVRLRAFLVADLARYRAALPGAAAGYLALLADCLDAGHPPTADDLAALGALRGAPAAAALLHRCRTLTPPVAPPRESTSAHPVPAVRPAPVEPPAPAARPAPVHPTGPLCPGGGAPTAVTASRGVLQALMGGLPDGRGVQQEDGADEKPAQKPAAKPGERPAPAQPGTAPAPKPVRRPVPTPGEVFPRRKPGPPSGKPQQCLVMV